MNQSFITTPPALGNSGDFDSVQQNSAKKPTFRGQPVGKTTAVFLCTEVCSLCFPYTAFFAFMQCNINPWYFPCSFPHYPPGLVRGGVWLQMTSAVVFSLIFFLGTISDHDIGGAR